MLTHRNASRIRVLACNHICVYLHELIFTLHRVCVCVCVARALGLHIKGIEESSRAKRENLFEQDECIVQINDTPLQDKTFAQ